jgi:membrane protein YdbS with pleckstrin-like domain
VSDAKERLGKAVEQARSSGDGIAEVGLWQGSYSPRAMCGTWLAAGTATLLGLLALSFSGGLRGNRTAWLAFGAVALLVWLVPSTIALYRKLVHHYELTNQRLKHREGFLVRTMHRVELIDIDDVVYRQGPIQQLLDVGDITIKSTDESHPQLFLRGIASVRKVADQIDDARRGERRRRGLHIESV